MWRAPLLLAILALSPACGERPRAAVERETTSTRRVALGWTSPKTGLDVRATLAIADDAVTLSGVIDALIFAEREALQAEMAEAARYDPANASDASDPLIKVMGELNALTEALSTTPPLERPTHTGPPDTAIRILEDQQIRGFKQAMVLTERSRGLSASLAAATTPEQREAVGGLLLNHADAVLDLQRQSLIGLAPALPFLSGEERAAMVESDELLAWLGI